MEFSDLKNLMDRLTAWRMPGNTISVYYKNKEVFRYSSGYADRERGIKMTGDEFLNIYSCSKPATVTAALQLYEKGYFLLSDPVSEFIPAFGEMYVKNADGGVKKAKNTMTMRHLFTMTSGLTYDLESKSIEQLKADTDGRAPTVTAAEYIAREPLAFEPGTRWEYGLSHDVLAAVVEVISGRRFCEYVRENIFEPLEIEAYYHGREKLHMAEMYEFCTNSGAVDVVEAQKGAAGAGEGRAELRDARDIGGFMIGSEYDSGGAGIAVRVPDYAKFADALANGGRGATGEQILTPGTIELMRTNQLSAELMPYYNWSALAGYGYGLGVRTMMDRALSGSNGSVGAFGWGGAAGANIGVDPDTGLSYFYAHHMLNAQEEYYQPRIRNLVYAGFGSAR